MPYLKQSFKACLSGLVLGACTPMAVSLQAKQLQPALQRESVQSSLSDNQTLPLSNSRSETTSVPLPVVTLRPSPEMTEPAATSTAKLTEPPLLKHSPEALQTVAKLDIVPSRYIVSRKGESTRFVPLLQDAQGRFLSPENHPLIWRVKDPSLYTIDPQGNVTALANSGFTTITVTEVASGLTATATITLGSTGEASSHNKTQSVSASVTFEGL